MTNKLLLQNYIKSIIFIILTFICLNSSFAQENRTSRKHFRYTVGITNFENYYDKKTGEKISPEEFKKIVKNGIKHNVEFVIGEEGEFLKHIIDFEGTHESGGMDISLRTKVGETFPNFIVKTINDKIINLNDLKGKIVIIRFELNASGFRFKKDKVIALDDQINDLKNGKDIVKAIIFIADSKREIIDGFEIENCNFDLIPSAKNFHFRYLINRTPTTIVIDEEGNLLGYFSDSDDIIIKDLLSKD